ncbi:MAG: SDR family oxidoreductase [Betaproteobacteria bacterium]|jgi:NAD(P)-dependent dehydrogenase (short-subunit alcohol dehydrogenase family)
MTPDLRGKVALVTGGASGIGRAIAQAFVAAGCRVALADIAQATQTAQALGDADQCLGLEVDVADPGQVQRAFEAAAAHFGGLDILVNNAGLFGPLGFVPIEDIDALEMRRVFEVNVFGVIHCTQAALPHLRRRGGGTIVNLASNTPFRGTPLMAHYVASKGAVVALTRAAARELGSQGIRVNAVAPGFTLSDAVLDNPVKIARVGARARDERALARDQLPEDVVGPVLFLASAASGFVTGQTLIADGGAHFA